MERTHHSEHVNFHPVSEQRSKDSCENYSWKAAKIGRALVMWFRGGTRKPLQVTPRRFLSVNPDARRWILMQPSRYRQVVDVFAVVEIFRWRPTCMRNFFIVPVCVSMKISRYFNEAKSVSTRKRNVYRFVDTSIFRRTLWRLIWKLNIISSTIRYEFVAIKATIIGSVLTSYRSH